MDILNLTLQMRLLFMQQQTQTNKVHISITNTKLFFLSISPPIIPPYHPGDGCIAKWSRSSCITEDTAGTVTTASPAPAVTRSCLMELVLSWTFTPLKMTTCWMGMLPPQVGNTGTTGYQIPPPDVIIIIQTLMSPHLLCLSIS